MANGQTEAVLKPPPGLMEGVTAAEASDGQLLGQFVADRDHPSEMAFATLVRRHGPMVFRVCRLIIGDRHTAEDAFQATFLILARRAGSIHQPELLGHWLHGVALRTAREARMRVDRRRRRECPGSNGLAGEPIDESGRPDLHLVCREEFEALHEEVSRLPERYRIPVVLCDLEGLTYQDAARRLGCPVGTIGVRLRRARERLRMRMTRRGLAPAAGLLSVLLDAEASSAYVPSALVENTTAAAMGFAANTATATGAVSAPVAALTERMLRTMAFSRLKLATYLALAAGIAVAVGWLGTHREQGMLATSGQEKPRASDQATPRRIGVSIEQSKTQPPDNPQPPRTAASLEQNEPQPKVAPPPPRKATSLEQGTPRPDEHELAKDSHETILKIENDEANVAGRLLRDEQARGQVLFAKEWVPNDPRSHSGDGLGPVYNETSCVACHGLGAPGGAGPESKNVVLITATPSGCGTPTGLDQIHPGFRGSKSAVLHRYGTEPEYASWRRRFFGSNRNEQSNQPANRREDSVEGRIRAFQEQTGPDRGPGKRSPSLPPMSGFALSVAERNTPALFGVGRIDEIPSEVLVAVAASQAAGVRGRISRTREGRIGRFGWKAQLPNLHEFVRGACANELGLEVPGHSQGTSPLAPSKNAKGLDLTEAECDDLVSFIRALPAPVAVDPSGLLGTEDMRAGRRLFADAGCASCHTATLGSVQGIYSDLLLHDMGGSLSDSGSTYGIGGPKTPDGPTPREWRTPPLWGYRDSGPYLHDGRAHNLEEAVALHEGQGKKSAHRFFALSSRARAQVEAFLKSLIAPTAAAAPGVILAAELESRIEKAEQSEPETLARERRERAAARDEEQFRAAQRQQRAQKAAKRARVQIPIAESLEKMGKINGAIAFYQDIAREASGTEEGRLAAARISELSTRKEAR